MLDAAAENEHNGEETRPSSDAVRDTRPGGRVMQKCWTRTQDCGEVRRRGGSRLLGRSPAVVVIASASSDAHRPAQSLECVLGRL